MKQLVENSPFQFFLDYINNETPKKKNEILEDYTDPAEIGSKYLYDLTPKEKIGYVYDKIEGLKLEVRSRMETQAGRLTREQTYRLCMYRRELKHLQSGEVF